MKTKMVYVLVSNDKDYYLEQAYVSMFSLKKYNPKAQIYVVADQDTVDGIKSNSIRQKLSVYVDSFISVDFDKTVGLKERSRFLKTTLRKHVDGDFLFLDTDTIICDSLSEIDNWNIDLGIVLDLHSHLLEHPYQNGIRQNVLNMYKINIPKGIDYYNSGVMFVRDSFEAERPLDADGSMLLQ